MIHEVKRITVEFHHDDENAFLWFDGKDEKQIFSLLTKSGIGLLPDRSIYGFIKAMDLGYHSLGILFYHPIWIEILELETEENIYTIKLAEDYYPDKI